LYISTTLKGYIAKTGKWLAHKEEPRVITVEKAKEIQKRETTTTPVATKSVGSYKTMCAHMNANHQLAMLLNEIMG
jgi:hypothetical protein